MESAFKFPASPGTPLHQASPDRVNHQRTQSYFDELPNPLSRHSRESSVHDKVAVFNSLAYQGKQLERKTNDAALKRAMLGREEAESEMRRYREDGRLLKRQIEEGQGRERKVMERLENVMENYGRAKETHAHTQTLWEKEIRRARKDNFKSQSMIVKLQEELKSSRQTAKSAQMDYEKEKERSVNREQEAFSARYQLVTVQEELSQLHDKIRLVEQERDALRTIAKNEEIARIAAEGQLPLPPAADGDEFASPKKARRTLDPFTILSSAASEEELDDIRMLLQWEQQRADRAHDRVDFLEAECRLNCFASRATLESKPQAASPDVAQIVTVEVKRTNTIFIPSEGIFRTVSPAHEKTAYISPEKQSPPNIFHEESHETVKTREPTPNHDHHDELQVHDTRTFARTPSCEPPAPAVIRDIRTSLMSLLNAPQSPGSPNDDDSDADEEETVVVSDPTGPTPTPTLDRVVTEDSCRPIPTFRTISTTTSIPLASPPDLFANNDSIAPAAVPNALSPTMSREEALAQIRERRGRARSLAQGTATPRKQMVEGKERRDISAPAIRSGNVRGRLASRTR
ncbi:hypothetical protein BJ878DRAFT_436745 [Calycina marina]|uniref:Uncharacterized protein n=1 Tax=Calycina marina TaxID=1763456 RepID=A0A9P7Z7C6_9HELO|nr:hypothetical protein BJ878DRAFT_436745 [Calycina marina]